MNKMSAIRLVIKFRSLFPLPFRGSGIRVLRGADMRSFTVRMASLAPDHG